MSKVSGARAPQLVSNQAPLTDAPLYGRDNEYGRRAVTVAPFEARRDLVTNDELLAFVQDGGYAQDALWSDASRTWRDGLDRAQPRWWTPTPAAPPPRYSYRALFDALPLPLAWPAEVNAFEALVVGVEVGRREVPARRLPARALSA